MNKEILHNIRNIPFNERETFNNAILLLSMVKSEYYYIVGFSRPENKIEVGFELQDKLYGQISETVVMDFSSETNSIKMFSELKNVVFEGETDIPFLHNDSFIMDNGAVYYDRLFDKDEVIPSSMDKINLIILSVKKEINEFINQSMEYILEKNREKNENN